MKGEPVAGKEGGEVGKWPNGHQWPPMLYWPLWQLWPKRPQWRERGALLLSVLAISEGQ